MFYSDVQNTTPIHSNRPTEAIAVKAQQDNAIIYEAIQDPNEDQYATIQNPQPVELVGSQSNDYDELKFDKDRMTGPGRARRNQHQSLENLQYCCIGDHEPATKSGEDFPQQSNSPSVADFVYEPEEHYAEVGRIAAKETLQNSDVARSSQIVYAFVDKSAKKTK